MKNNGLLMLGCLGLIVLGGCSETTVRQVDLTRQQGLYIVGYTDDPVVRTRIEDQLVADLIEQDIIALASYEDIAEITASTPQTLIDEAVAKKAMGIIVVNQVAADASDSIVQNPDRISPLHPTLQGFYSYSRDLAGETYTEDREAFAEVNLFLLDNGEAKLYWSGTTWSFEVDNQGGAIRDLSRLIVQQLVELRQRVLQE